jgi:predicted ester cyclase
MTETANPVDLVERMYAAMNTGDPELIEDVAANVLAPAWRNEPLAPGQKPGADGFRAFVPWLRTVWPDFSCTHDEVVVSADGSTVAFRSTSRVTHTTGDFFGIPATGRTAAYNAFDFRHIAEGRIQRSYHVEDFLGLAMQLGAHLTPGS